MSEIAGKVSFRAEGSWWKAWFVSDGEKPILLAQVRINLVPAGSENYHKFMDIITAGVALGFQEISPGAEVEYRRSGGIFRQ